jgi:hypothetical protein
MPLVVRDGDRINSAQPISAVVVVKAMDENGKLFYSVTATSDVHTVECMGMIEFASKRIYARL